MKKRKRTSLYANIIFSIIALVSLTITIVVLLVNYSVKNQLEKANADLQTLENRSNQYIYTQADLDGAVLQAKEEGNAEEKNLLLDNIKQRLSNGDSAYELVRSLFPENLIVMADSRYIFYPIVDEYKHHNYIAQNFVIDEETQEITYQDGNGNVISSKGIDVSKHNGEIDWQKVKADGVDFAFIRVGYRGSSEGKIVLDDYFERNIKGAIENDINVGVYFFTQAINKMEAIEEADFVLDAIEPYRISLPVALDIEELDGSRGDKIDASTRTDAAIAFLERVNGAGYTPMIYGNLKSMLYMLETDRIEPYEKWFAYYHTPLYYPYEHAIWQYNSKGSVDGIKGDVDLNILMKQ